MALAPVLYCGMGAGVGGPGVIAVQGEQGHANGSPREWHQSQDDPEPSSINLLALSLSQPRARIASEDGCPLLVLRTEGQLRENRVSSGGQAEQ